jgi:hypothetical protein
VTASKKKPPATQRCPVDAVQAYMTSLIYLREEARRDGLEAVADILWNALASIEKWLESWQAPLGSHDILDLPLCRSLEFLFNWMALPQHKQKEVVQEIARYEVTQAASVAGPPVRRRVSKKIAG